MPIIETPPHGVPPSQGDILKGIRLYVTNREADGEDYVPADAGLGLCLVLSRPCVVNHKPSLVVSGVMRYSHDINNNMTIDEMVDFLKHSRDGVSRPDQFYLGHLPGYSGRYCARLDSLHTIKLPQKPDDKQKFIDGCRVGRLCIDFVRDLHIRVHQAFANMGFEDYRWLSDGDLRLVVEKGRSEIARVEEEQRMAQLTRESAGKRSDAKQDTADQNKIDSLKRELEPYTREFDRRVLGTATPGE